MTTRSWIRNLFTRPPRTIRKAPARCWLVLEALEDRALPSVNFYPVVNYGTGSSPRSVAVGDVNGDGKQDLVVANVGSNTVSVLLNNGAGAFQSAVNYAVGSSPDSVAVGDFNGDGKQDLVVANAASNTVSVLLNNGAGAFQSAINYAVGSSPRSVAVGDFNSDGKQDLVVANAGSNTVSVLLNNGAGTFQSAVGYGVGSVPESVAVGDFNGDGKQDLAVVNTHSSNTISVLLNNGGGTFQSAVSYGGGGSGNGTIVASVAVGDFNGDGKQDLAVAAYDNNAVAVLLGNGNGTFGNSAAYFAGLGPSSVAVGDFNGDGKQDLAVADSTSNSVSVLPGSGTPAFGDPVRFFNGVGGLPLSVAVGDFNGDGKPDLAEANNENNSVSVWLNNTAPTIASNQATVTGNEGSQATNSGTFNDAQGRITVKLTASLGTVTQNNTTGAWSWSYAPPDGPASATVTITATDTGGLTATTSFTLNTLNVPPTVTITGAPASSPEGTAISLGSTVTDRSSADTAAGFTRSWSVTKNGSAFAAGSGAGFAFTPDDNGTYVVTLTATDKDGGVGRASATIGVTNVAPTITAFTVPASGAEGSPVNLSAAATDPGVLDTLTYTWTITRPDGTNFATLTGAQASFTPPDNGIYGVSLTVTDKDGGTAHATTASAGLISWWRGEGDATDVLGANNGTLGSGVTFAPGEVGQAFNLSGSNQVTVADAPNLDHATAVTLEAWINPSTLAFNNGFGAVIAKSSGTARNYGFFVKSNGALHLSYFTTGGTNVFLETAANRVPVGQFSHVAAVIDPSAGVMQIYLNGKLVASRATGGPLVANSVPLTIGLSDPGFNYGFKGLIDEPSVYGRALSQGEIQAIVNAGSTGKIPPVAVANVAPTPTLSGFGTGLATEILTYTAAATDPSPIDTTAGFAYGIDWGDGSPIQSVAATAGNGSGVSLSHVFTSAGTYTVTLSGTDKDSGTGSVPFTVTVLDVTSANLQTVINQQGSISFQDNTDAQAQSVLSAVNGLSAQSTPVTLTMNLGSANYTDLAPSPPAGVTLVISGSGGATTIVGHSPAVNVSGGNVVIEDLTLVTDTDSPTVMVSNGNLTLRNVDIEGTGSGSQPAVEITGGIVDLGTAADPGGNVFNAHGQGELIHNTGGNGVTAVGDTFEADGTTLTSPYRIKDKIFDALNVGGGGLVTYVPGNDYISVNGGNIQRGVNAIATRGTVNVEAGGLYKQYDAGSKLLTVRFDGGPTLSQQADPQDASLRDLVVTGTAGDDHIQFTPGGSGVQAQVNDVPNGRFNPTGRLVAYGLTGNDTIKVAGNISLPASLFGGDGSDLLQGGGGNDVLVGGAGNNTLIAGQGRDLLIGGSGAAHLIGNSGDDILIAGTTAFDDNQPALDAVMAEWTSSHSYADRVTNLSGAGSGLRANGDVFLIASGPAATVFANGAVNRLQGGSGMDWFFADLAQDIIHGLHDGEFVDQL